MKAGRSAAEEQAKARAEELAKANESLRQELAELNRAAEERDAELNLLSASGKDFLSALEKYKAGGAGKRGAESGNAAREAKESWIRRLSPFKREPPRNP